MPPSSSSGRLAQLPEELLIRIFEYLSSAELCRCACVSAAWTSVVLDPKFWPSIHFDNLRVDAATVLRVCRRYPNLNALSLRNLPIESRMLLSVFRACPRITELTLAGTRVTGMDQLLHDMTHILTGLRHLDLSTQAITNGMLRRLEDMCRSLERLNLSRCTLSLCETMASGLRVLQLSHPNLRELKLSGFGRVMGIDLRCPALESLDASTSQLTDAMLLPMLGHIPRLRTLSLADCRNITDPVVKDALSRCTELRSLNLTGCVSLSPDVLRKAATWAPRLERLSMGRCPLLSDLATSPLSSAHLEFLDLRECENLKDLDVSSPSLRELKLTSCRSLSRLVAHCEQLRTLSLDGCDSLLNIDLRTSLQTLELSDSRGHLKEMALRNELISSLSLHSFSSMHTLRLECPALLSLDLGRCSALSDASVANLAHTCPRLLELSLEDCEHLTQLSLESRSLAKLNLTGCKMLLGAKLRCAALNSLVLEGCSALDNATILCAVRSLDLGTCRQLHRLALSSDKCHALLLKGCLRLQQVDITCAALRAIDLSFCAELSDSALRALASGSVLDLNLSRCVRLSNELVASISQVFPRLQSLNLSYLHLADQTLSALLLTRLSFRSLVLAACKELTFSCLASVLSSCSLVSMEALDVSYTSAGAEAVSLWLALCPALRSLKLNGCLNVASSSLPLDALTSDFMPAPPPPFELDWLRCLSEHKCLRQLSLVGCNRLTHLTLRGSGTLVDVNVRSCVALRDLSVSGCRSLHSLSANECAALEKVGFSGCPALDALDIRCCPPALDLQMDNETKRCLLRR